MATRVTKTLSSKSATPARVEAPARKATAATPSAFKPDEMSNGKGGALRRAAVSRLGANLPQAGLPPPVKGFLEKIVQAGQAVVDNVKWALDHKNDVALAAELAARGVVVSAGNLLGDHLPGGPALQAAIDRAINTPPPSAPFPSASSLPISANPAGPSYAPTSGPLWDPKTGPVPSQDVKQGPLGDCYLMASMASMSGADAEKLIQDNRDGTYTVRLYDTDASGKITPVFVRVDGALPSPANAGYTDAQKWVAIVEKAAAIHAGGYEQLSGDLNTSFFATPTLLTGRQTVAYYAPAAGTGLLYERMQAASADGRAMFVGGTNPQTPGVYAEHAYSVIDVRTDASGQQYVTLRNPWGNSEPGNDGADDGTFEMKIEDFARDFPFLAVAGG